MHKADANKTPEPALLGEINIVTQQGLKTHRQKLHSYNDYRGRTDRVSEPEYLLQLESNYGRSCREGAERIIIWFRSNGFDVGVTVGRDGMYVQSKRWDGRPIRPFLIWRSGRIEITLGSLASIPAFRDDRGRQQIHDRLASMPGADLRTTGNLMGSPSLALEEVLKEALWHDFQQIALDIQTEIRRVPPPA